MLQVARLDVSGKRTIDRRGSKATMAKAVLERVTVVLGMRDRIAMGFVSWPKLRRSVLMTARWLGETWVVQ